MRAFIAINLPSEIKAGLAKVQDKLKIISPGIIQAKPANLHLTLKFLGNISLQQTESIQQAITGLIKTIRPFKIKLDTLGVFPDDRQARIIWIGTRQPTAQIQQLVSQLEENLLSFSLPQETRHFQAHITLGRIKQPINFLSLKENLDIIKSEIPDLNLEFNIRGITLYQSILGPGGPHYNILKEVNF
ncbi:MAG: RNA 2',3'-cyclic phosphodiesterase [Candidatus Omnitrophica bacterium]|nr:RNA 2',3'-cyclic phosphodiesterase [Candidatus Omnitrophota bacterium]